MPCAAWVARRICTRSSPAKASVHGPRGPDVLRAEARAELLHQELIFAPAELVEDEELIGRLSHLHVHREHVMVVDRDPRLGEAGGEMHPGRARAREDLRTRAIALRIAIDVAPESAMSRAERHIFGPHGLATD